MGRALASVKIESLYDLVTTFTNIRYPHTNLTPNLVPVMLSVMVHLITMSPRESVHSRSSWMTQLNTGSFYSCSRFISERKFRALSSIHHKMPNQPWNFRSTTRKFAYNSLFSQSMQYSKWFANQDLRFSVQGQRVFARNRWFPHCQSLSFGATLSNGDSNCWTNMTWRKKAI